MAVVVGTNSYISVADATTYFSDRLNVAEWTAATDADKGKALVMAARSIDNLSFTGRITESDQAMAWPRSGVADREGRCIDDDDVPQQVLDAQCETALALIRGDISEGADRDVRRVRAGTVELEYRTGAPVRMVPDVAMQILSQFLDGSGQYSIRMVP